MEALPFPLSKDLRYGENDAHLTTNPIPRSPTCTIRQLSCVQDSQSYSKTIAALRVIEPDEILLHDGTRDRVLSTQIVGEFHGKASRVLFVSRQYFDQDKVIVSTPTERWRSLRVAAPAQHDRVGNLSITMGPPRYGVPLQSKTLPP